MLNKLYFISKNSYLVSWQANRHDTATNNENKYFLVFNYYSKNSKAYPLKLNHSRKIRKFDIDQKMNADSNSLMPEATHFFYSMWWLSIQALKM